MEASRGFEHGLLAAAVGVGQAVECLVEAVATVLVFWLGTGEDGKL
jgi:hypothetical protein